MTRITNRRQFAEHASPEAIESRLMKTQGQRRRLDSQISWLEELLVRRTAERNAGTWPAQASEEQTGSSNA